MKLTDVPAAAVTDIALRVADLLGGFDGVSFEYFEMFEPLHIHPIDDDQVELSQGGVRLVAQLADRTAGEHLRRLPSPNCRLACLTAGDASAAVLRVWTFGRGRSIVADSVSLRLDENVLSSIARHIGRPVDDSGAREWVEGEFLLEGGIDGCSRALARVDPSEGSLGRAFSLVGTATELDIREIDGRLRCTRLAPRRQVDGLRVVLVEAPFEVMTDLQTDGDSTTSLAAILAEGGYLERWSRYNELEHAEERELAEQTGTTTYADTELLPNGAWRFHVSDSDGFLGRIQRGTPLAAQAEDTGLDRSKLSGEVETVNRAAGTLDLRSIQAEAVPPPHGTLCYALGGSTASYQRRLDAALKLATGAIPLPSLGALLEMRSAPAKAVDRRLGWSSPGVRKIFDGQDPTEAQKRAIEIALNTPDIAVIQGPPGTGKTKVISAITARIAEELGEVAASRQILLTSHQHEAVDNVASRTTIFGLPTVKEGRGEHGATWLQAWRQDRLRHAAALLEATEQGELAQMRGWISDRRDGYILAPVSNASAGDLLLDVAHRCADYLPAHLSGDLLTTAGRLQWSPTNVERSRNLLRSIRALRTTHGGHADDGASNAGIAKIRIEKDQRAAHIDLSPLARAQEGPTISQEDLAAVATLKDLLLDTFGLSGLETATPTRNGEVIRLLTEVLSALEERLNRDGHGAALVLGRFVHDLETDPNGVELALSRYGPVVAATCQASSALALRPGSVDRVGPVDTVIVDEAARVNPLDLQIPLCLASRRVILVGDQRQLPHIVEQHLAGAVATNEAEAAELEESLFGRLHRFLIAERRSGRPDRVVTLNSQYRMHPRLGRFVSAAFYEPYGETIDSPLPESAFEHDLPGYQGHCASWLDVPAAHGQERRASEGFSRVRDVEADEIATEVHRLMVSDPTLTFGIITFYKAQVDRILEALVPLGVAGYDVETGALAITSSQWRFTRNRDGEEVERLRVGTVDAFQGKEFDVVFLSTVRTPKVHVHAGTRPFGHLVVENRLCVAMSRQKRLLVVVGDRSGLTAHPDSARQLRPLVEFSQLCEEVVDP